LIKTDWVKCDSENCNLVAWYKISYDEFFIVRNVCQKHLDEYKEMLANWKIEEIKETNAIK
jgi:hypothetical protein